MLERESRGYDYVAEDLFAHDAGILGGEGWTVHSTDWWDETGKGLEGAVTVLGILAGLDPRGPGQQRREWILAVVYHRWPGWRRGRAETSARRTSIT